MFLAKVTFIYTPAVIVWLSLLSGTQLLDIRSDDELLEDENEARRLERFFDVETLGELEYIPEWSAKEEALSQMVDKLFKSKEFMNGVASGPEVDGSTEEVSEFSTSTNWKPDKDTAAVVQAAQNGAVEISYVLPPPTEEDEAAHSPGATWEPRLVLAHRSGGIALVHLAFEHVQKAKDREERWACTKLICDLVASPGGVAGSERICDLRGPLPHGVRYMRVGGSH